LQFVSTPSLQHLFLTGYRGSGKSTVAESLAHRLHLESVDTDRLIEQSVGKTIAEIFQDSGENSFRNLESEVIQQICSSDTPMIVSLGGGAILRPNNREQIRANGWCVWLKASASELARRIASDRDTAATRPALSQLGVLGEIESILAKRTPLYESVAHASYDTETLPFEELTTTIARDYHAWRTTRETHRG
jgi:shikimate kinase